ncbi:hypothetical protein AAY473_040713 [Plecturocebus cupreus]
MAGSGWVQCLTPVIPAIWEGEVDHLRRRVRDQPDKHRETPSLLISKLLERMRQDNPLNPGGVNLWWAEIMPFLCPTVYERSICSKPVMFTSHCSRLALGGENRGEQDSEELLVSSFPYRELPTSLCP